MGEQDSMDGSPSTNGVATQNNQPQQKKRTPFTPQRNNLSDDELLAKFFYDIIQLKFDRGELSRIRKEPQDRRKLNRVMLTGKILGGLAAVGTFVALRRFPKYCINRTLSKKESFMHGRDGNPYYELARKQGPWLPHIKTLRDGSTRFQEGWLITPILFTLDAALACALGTLIMFVTTPKVKMFEAIADIPLSAGRSAVSDGLCADFLENYKRLPVRLWTAKKLDGDDVTTNIKRFVENCQRRQQMERQLRADAMIGEGEPVDIPKPGVPPELTLEREEEPEPIIDRSGERTDFWDAWMEEDDDDDDMW